MKSFLIIGMGRFGYYLCKKLNILKNEVMIVDINEDSLSPYLELATSAKIGDCTNPEVLKALGINDFDACFVCIGRNFQSSLEVTSLLSEMGAKMVISRASTDVQAKFLLRNGANQVIYPERDIAERIARRVSANHVFDYIELSEEYGVYEMEPPVKWHGKTIVDINIRAKYNINILGIKNLKNNKIFMPVPSYKFVNGERMLIMGSNEDLSTFLASL